MTRNTEQGLNHILLATDFSSRSDRATSRALLLAKQWEAGISIVHVVDDDQPDQLIKAATREAEQILKTMRDTFRDVHRVDCEFSIAVGEAFAGVLSSADETGADIIVVGPHRRQILKDVFTGTTAERIIRKSSRPVLMANGPPTGDYRSVLVATDLSPASVPALRICTDFQLASYAEVSLAYVFDTPASGHLRRASLSKEEVEDYISQEQADAQQAVSGFLQQHSFEPDRIMLRPEHGSVVSAIEEAAGECNADLVIVGTHGRSGLSKALLGSVTEALMRTSERDVLAVSP